MRRDWRPSCEQRRGLRALSIRAIELGDLMIEVIVGQHVVGFSFRVELVEVYVGKARAPRGGARS